VKVEALKADVRLMPYVLKDGDIIGYWIKSDYSSEINEKDDFTTDEDILAQERIKNLKLLTSSGQKNNEESDLYIDVGF